MLTNPFGYNLFLAG